VTPKDGTATYRLKSLLPDVGERFEMLEDGALFGSALLVRKQDKGTLYINQVNANGTAEAPSEAAEKCDHTYICRPLPEKEGRAILLKYGAKP